MRFQGKITEWRDEQGFGFVSQNGDGKRVFIHVKSFTRRARRPVLGDVITYRIAIENGRESAQDVAYAAAVGATARKPFGKSENGSLWIWLASLYLTLLCIAVMMRSLPWTVLGYIATINLLTYLAYALDKKAARSDAWRTPEGRLHFLGLMGGWPAGLLAQKRLRHKSSKSSFQTVYKATVLLHLTGVIWLFSSYGAHVRALLFAGH